MGNETVKSENIIELRHVMRQYDDNGSSPYMILTSK